MAQTRRRVVLVGLGTIARTHLEVLRDRPDVEVLGGVDPNPEVAFEGPRLSLDEALGLAPDLVVIATPTDTHPALVEQVLTGTGAMVLCEKPLARDSASIESLRSLAGLEERVRVSHHFAFSPEVEWARAYVEGWDPPARVLSVFNDAYGNLPPERRAGYVSTWVDSGPNQLSLLEPFVEGLRLVSHSDERVRAATAFDHDGGRTVLTSNWLAADSSKQTTLDYGDVEVRMDHTSMTVVVVREGAVVEHVGYTGSASRKKAHYLGVYDAVFGNPDDPRLGVPLAARIADLLEAAQRL